MSYSELLDFEDIFDDIADIEIVSPSEVEKRVRQSYSAWDSLYQSNKSNSYVVGEYKRFKTWANPVLKSKIDKMFASGTLADLDKWDSRYKVAYEKASVKTSAPTPGAMTQSMPPPSSFWDYFQNPFVLVGVGALGGIILIKLLKK
jgi:hypothetical protein